MTASNVPSAGWHAVYNALNCSPYIDEQPSWEVLLE